MPEDFVKYGMIPEFMGRVPVYVSLDLLDEEALVKILTEPRSAIVKQYQKLFELDNIRLEFDDDAVKAVAKQALERKTGARGLRAILEKVMMDLMYTVPSEENVLECKITKDVVENGGSPVVIYGDNVVAKPAAKKLPKKNSGEIA